MLVCLFSAVRFFFFFIGLLQLGFNIQFLFNACTYVYFQLCEFSLSLVFPIWLNILFLFNACMFVFNRSIVEPVRGAFNCTRPGPEVIKTFFMLNLAELEISKPHNY